MAFPKGGTGNGRPKGSPNKSTIIKQNLQLETIAAIEEGIKSGRLVSPLDYLIQVYQDEDKPEGVRLAAAKAAIPYLHSAKPTQINQTIQSPDSLFEINLVSPDKD